MRNRQWCGCLNPSSAGYSFLSVLNPKKMLEFEVVLILLLLDIPFWVLRKTKMKSVLTGLNPSSAGYSFLSILTTKYGNEHECLNPSSAGYSFLSGGYLRRMSIKCVLILLLLDIPFWGYTMKLWNLQRKVLILLLLDIPFWEEVTYILDPGHGS